MQSEASSLTGIISGRNGLSKGLFFLVGQNKSNARTPRFRSRACHAEPPRNEIMGLSKPSMESSSSKGSSTASSYSFILSCLPPNAERKSAMLLLNDDLEADLAVVPPFFALFDEPALKKRDIDARDSDFVSLNGRQAISPTLDLRFWKDAPAFGLFGGWNDAEDVIFRYPGPGGFGFLGTRKDPVNLAQGLQC